MRKAMLFLLGVIICVSFAGTAGASVSKTVLLEEDFESSLRAWDTNWKRTSLQANSDVYSVYADAAAGTNGQQTLTLVNGVDTRYAEEIRVHFYLWQNFTDSGSDIFMNLYADGRRIDSIDLHNSNQFAWREYSFVFRKTGPYASLFTRNFKIQFNAPNLTYNRWLGNRYPERVFLDDISINVVTSDNSFLPSKHGFHFQNGFTGDFFPLNPGLQLIWDFLTSGGPIGKYGLCGGMSYAVLDFYNLGLQIPADNSAPDTGDLYNYIWYRQYDQWGTTEDLAADVTAWLMTGRINNPRSTLGMAGKWMYDLTPDQRYQYTGDAMFDLLQKLDQNQLVPVFMQTQSHSSSDWVNFAEDVMHNHTVLCYAYEWRTRDNAIALKVYDSNYPMNDRVELIVKYNPGFTNVIEVTHNSPVLGPSIVYGLILTDYSFKNDITQIPAMLE